MSRYNPITADSYKFSHYLQFPPGTENTYYYIEARGGPSDATVFFGLQAWLNDFAARRITQTDINRRAAEMGRHGEPFNAAGFQRILDTHQGRWPVLIKALPEGTVVPVRNALVTVEATDQELFWLPGFIETELHRAVWYPTTVCTNSWRAKRVLKEFLDITSDDHSGLEFSLHDFGARGVSSGESAGLGGAAHLVNFKGTDTVEALDCILEHYNDDSGTYMPGFSIPAAEHSTITAWGRPNEIHAFENMLDKFGAKRGSVVAVVSDSYDIFNAVGHIWGEKLHERVSQSGARVVIRPDSGDPITILPRLLHSLRRSYGGMTNKKGYYVLHPSVRLIQGDGVTMESLPKILAEIANAGYSTENVAFGMGGGLLQKVDRDLYKFAMKESAVKINGEWIDAYKDPITDPGKTSKRGRLVVHSDGGAGIQTFRDDGASAWRDMLKPVFKNGEVLVRHTFEDIRARAKI